MKLFGTGNVSEHELIASIGFPAAILPNNGILIKSLFFYIIKKILSIIKDIVLSKPSNKPIKIIKIN